MATSATTLSDDVRLRLDALDIDTSCALRFERATVHALAAMSKEARETIDRCLGEEAAMVRIEDLAGSAAVAALLNETRHAIRANACDSAEAARRDLERMLVESAADLDGVPRAAKFD